MIFQADTELVRQNDHRLVGKAHAGRQGGAFAAHQVGSLVDRQADAMAGPVRQSGKLVIRTQAGLGENRPGGIIDHLAGLAGPGGDAIRDQSPLGRVARPEEVAYTVAFLASDGAEFLTGGVVDVNGASYLRT